jgi:protein SCO1
LPEGVEPPQTLLISIDPERDTPEQLAQYVSTKAFPANLQGLSGTPEQVRAAADAFLADYSRIEQPDSQSDYSMDHTSLLYLMDENWKLKTFFTHEDTDETIAACLAEQLN